MSISKKDKIVDFFLTSGATSVSEIARKLGVSKGLVSLVFDEMADLGIIENGKINKNKARLFKMIFNTKKLLSMNFENLAEKYNLIGIGVFGSYARGEDDPSSDVDIWIRPARRITSRELASLRKDLVDLFGKDVDILVVNNSRINRLKESDSPLYCDLIHSLVLYGDLID